MALLKTYTISTAITAGVINEDVLHTEISDTSHVINYDGLSVRGDTLKILGDSLANETALDALILAHIIEPLPNLKTKRYEEIDKKSKSLIAVGFIFDSQAFSLSNEAQLNWDKLKNQSSEYIWPLDITTIENDTYSLELTNLRAFWNAGKDSIKTNLDAGRALKKQVFDAVNKTAVDAVVDNR